MRTRQFTLIAFLISGIVIWFTQRWWLPFMLAQVPLLEEYSDLIQTIADVIGTVAIGVGALVAILRWTSQPSQQSSNHEPLGDSRILEPTSYEEILKPMQQSGQIEWVDRESVAPNDLYGHRC